ncbi:MAG: patatin [Rhodocyclaceae bacterium]|nr:patatin [Rhodocyclaceae bacterium]
MGKMESASTTATPRPGGKRRHLPGRIVLVLQGGGALGAFQAGVYEAMHDAGIEPEWLVGTSIGAINGAIIAGNEPRQRLTRLREFWDLAGRGGEDFSRLGVLGLGGTFANLSAVFHGIPGFFEPNRRAWWGVHVPVGVTDASFYSTAPLRETLNRLVDFRHIGAEGTRLTLGAVNARTGRMRYFDSRDDHLALDHVMASAALPPAFPAVIIDGEPYWDGGVYSNTPIEVVMDEAKRHDSVIFATQLWQQDAEAPSSIQQVLSRMKDVQYSSRDESHIARQQQIHHLRHVVRELGRRLPESERARPEIQELIGWGCATVMHIVSIRAPRFGGEDFTKDIDFTAEHIRARWDAGRELTRQKIEAAPWEEDFDPVLGVVLHE